MLTYIGVFIFGGAFLGSLVVMAMGFIKLYLEEKKEEKHVKN